MISEFTVTSPEQKGLSCDHVIDFYQQLSCKNLPIHSSILYIDGAIVSQTHFAPIRDGQLHRMFSIAKTISALAIGILIDRSKISLTDHIVDYFPEKLPEKVHPYLAELTIRDILMMRTCYTQSTYNKFDLSSDWVGSFFTAIPDKAPGTIFHYDTAAAHVLAALVEKLTGQSLMDFLRSAMPELHLSQESYMLVDGQGTSMGGTGLMATSEDLLRIGILLLNHGCYCGKQLISKEYVQEAVSNLSPTVLNAPLPSEACGYGYMIWQTEKHGFVCYGMGGQLIMVHPAKKVILITTADTQGYAGGNQIIYDAFYQSIYKNISAQPLPDNPGGLEELRNLEHNNRLKPIGQCLVGATAGSAQALKKYRPNKEMQLSFPDNKYQYVTLQLTLQSAGGTLQLKSKTDIFTFSFAYDSQSEGVLGKYNTPYAGSGCWLTENTLYLYFHLLGEAVGSIRMELIFAEDHLVLCMRKVEETLFQEFQGTYVCHK